MFGLRSRRVLVDDQLADAVVVVDGERIASVGERAPSGVPVEDLGDLVLMAGLVDSHVHVNEPGRTEWEGFETATRAAAAGGITTIVDMPLNCIPVTTSAEALRIKLEACAPLLHVDAAFWGGVVPGNADQMRPLAQTGAVGAKCFLCHSGIDDFPNSTAGDLLRAMPALRDAGGVLLVHAELEGDHASDGPPSTYGTYLDSRPKSWEDKAIALVIDLCRQTRCPVHVVHLSSASALPRIAAAKAEGLPFTVETCPHYLCLTAEEVPDGATAYKCAPPIREASNREALWNGLREGIIDVVVSDHSPCTPHLKVPERGDFMAAWGGIASLQFGLSTVWTEASRRGFGVADLHRWMSRAPARLAGLGHRKGALVAGHDADLVAWDPDATWTITPDLIQHRHKVTPYLGRAVRGKVVRTWLRGTVIADRGTVTDRPTGRALLGRHS